MSVASGFRNLYRGESRIEFIAHRRWWYYASAVIILISLISFIFRGFNIGVEFKGGSQYQLTVTNTSITSKQVENAFADAGSPPADAAQTVGSGSSKQIVVQLPTQDPATQGTVISKVSSDLKLPEKDISVTSVSSSWGSDITKKAIEGLVIFLIVVTIYISLRFNWRMAVAALIALAARPAWSPPVSTRSSASR